VAPTLLGPLEIARKSYQSVTRDPTEYGQPFYLKTETYPVSETLCEHDSFKCIWFKVA
jgi:hypothetical protein